MLFRSIPAACGASGIHYSQVLTQQDARKIAKKLNAEIRPGRRHELAVFRHQGKYVTQFGISRGSKQQSHDYIPRQLFLTYRQCLELLDCSLTLTLEAYLGILGAKGLFTPPGQG